MTSFRGFDPHIDPHIENTAHVKRTNASIKAAAGPLTAKAPQTLLRDKTNKVKSVQPPETIAKKAVIVPVNKSDFKTPSPSTRKRVVASPTPGPVIQETATEEDDAQFENREVEQAASNPPIIDFPYEPPIDMPDFKSMDLRGWITRLPEGDADDTIDVDPIFPAEEVDWNQIVLRNDLDETSSKVATEMKPANLRRTSQSTTNSRARTVSTTSRASSGGAPTFGKSSKTQLDRNIDLILGKKSVPIVDLNFRLRL